MKTIKQIVENIQQPLVETLDQYNQHYVECDNLREILLQLTDEGDSNFGNIVLLASEFDSGKGFLLNNLLDIQGEMFDVSQLQSLSVCITKLHNLVQAKTGKAVSQLDLQQPEEAAILHQALTDIDINEQQSLFASILVHEPSHKPNLILNLDLSAYQEFENTCYSVARIGYDKSKIHVVWVINTLDVAIEKNNKSKCTVSREVLLNTRDLIALTMKQILRSENLRKLLDGKMIFAFNQNQITAETKELDYAVLKEVNKAQISLDEIDTKIVDKVSSFGYITF